MLFKRRQVINILISTLAGCSHGRSYEYYAESINSNKGFYALPCTSLFDIKGNNCTGDKILMGDPTPHTAQGIYYLKTSNKPTFALGMETN